ncbi:extracellular catalytic domain type 1 short-chain-length polyhydroxyalkanoate depolymerase [Aridibaculum aurantiacum]|uniref:extracellular catalytic domain type 1 short-chain-length polyhydroxyalkanoate depolymerase n=1 Tax=Aridibaculum aurantiacum TaxID=2810307 RepID=UPI001A96C366|nr:PHB depolymerase family esterase [Aridibaculum aurantiacum]
MNKSFLLVLLTLCVFQAFSQAKQFKVGDDRRRYIVYLPTGYHADSMKKYPLVFNFHGGGMTMTEQMFYSGMNKSADKNSFIAVYPQGINQDWNVGFETSYRHGTNDVGFVEKLLEYLVKQYRVDETAVYATGLSRGGFFCHRLAAELPGKIAAIASVGGLLPDSVVAFHTSKTPIPVMIIHGTADEVVKYEGKTGAYKSAAETYNYWKVLNNLSAAKETTTTIDRHRSDSTTVTTRTVGDGKAAVSLVSIVGGGHTLPGADAFNIGFPLGKTTREIEFNEITWNFFARYRRDK